MFLSTQPCEMKGTFTIDELVPHISWVHFFYTWQVSSHKEEAEKLRTEADTILAKLKDKVSVEYMLCPFRARSSGDDIILADSVSIPFLRQQVPGSDGSCLCLSDYVKERDDRIYIFATTVRRHDEAAAYEDDYQKLLTVTLSDRLAEAAAELLQQKVEQTEGLPQASLIRPAVGYPSIPDMSINFIVDKLCGFGNIGVRLTENGMMIPHSSVSGFIILNTDARYFSVGKISEEQLQDYARRRGFALERMKKFVNV